jgi:hypothetical protein
MTSLRILALVSITALVACGGDDDGGATDGDGSAADAGGGGGGGEIDAGGGGGGGGSIDCTADGPQCNNCEDDDGDELIDGADIQCSGALDDDESSFATGIPGDNIDPVLQDCFFDGNSGEGEDGCQRPTCCLTEGVSDTCPPPGPNSDCSVSQECIDFCAPLVPPGCDCFGCCTICNDTDCYDIAIGLAEADCDADTLDDPDLCPTCEKADDCAGEECNADPEDCILCPGETEADLPDTCTMQECPDSTPCDTSDQCGTDEYCSNGCCLPTVE